MNLINTWEIYWLWDFRKLPACSQIVNENDASASSATTRRLRVKWFLRHAFCNQSLLNVFVNPFSQKERPT